MSDQPIDRLARMKLNPSRSWPNVESTAFSASPTPRRLCGSVSSGGGGGEAGSVMQKTAARKYSAGDDEDDRLRAREVDDQRPEQREADGERGVERQGEDAVGGEQLAARHQGRDHRQLGRGEEDRDRRDEDVEQEDDREVRPGEVERHERGAAQEVRGDQDQPPIDAVDVDARDGREEDRRDEERQDQQADRGVRAGRVDDDDGQSEKDHVAADLGRHLRQPEAQEAAVLEDREGVPLVVWLAGRDGLGHADGPSEGVGDVEIAAVIAASPRETNPAIRASRTRRSSRTWRPQVWQRRPMSAPRRSISQVLPPHGWARRSVTTSPRSSVRTGWSGIGASGYQRRG